MTNPYYYVKRLLLPFITPRTESRPAPQLEPPLPLITPRIEWDFDGERVFPIGGLSSMDRRAGRTSPPFPIPTLRIEWEFDGERVFPRGSSGMYWRDPESFAVNTPTQSRTSGTAPVSSPANLPSEPPTPTGSTPSSASTNSATGTRSSQTVTRKIPKPNGEPGRPNSGGFNLKDTLTDLHNWSEKEVEDLIAFVRREARRTLDLSVSFRSQNSGAINALCEKAMEDGHFPILKDYDNCWPVRSALKLTLKYHSEATRRAERRNRKERILVVDAGSQTSGEE